jgi:hypothetical protein
MYTVDSSTKKYISKYVKSSRILGMLRSFFWRAMPAKGLSIWDLLFDYMELDHPLIMLLPNPTTPLVCWPFFCWEYNHGGLMYYVNECW